MIVHHYGFLTKNIEKSLRTFEKLGYEKTSDLINDSQRGIDILFIESKNNQVIELVSPNQPESVVNSVMKSQVNSIYHICYIVKSLELSIESLSKKNFVLIDPPKPAIAFDGKKVAFMMSRHTGIIELLEE